MRQKPYAILAIAGLLAFTSVEARIVNSINFTGARAQYDSEAEYRLLNLATAIVKARRADTDLSLDVKGAYGASILGDKKSHDAQLESAEQAATALKNAWADVALNAQSLQVWLDGRLRPEYSKAFKDVAVKHAELQERLIEEGASAPYMSWAFAEIAKTMESASDPSKGIIQCFALLEAMAKTSVTKVETFMKTVRELDKEEMFKEHGLYGHIFDYVAIKADKPQLFIDDEAFFSSVSKFDIYYEALEQISRETHKLVPKTHDLKFETFDLQFTPENVKLFEE